MDFKKHRWFYTSSGKLVVGGKSALQNDSLLKKLKASGKEYIVMHTSEPGSPFSVILADISLLSQEDIKECAVFTVCFSRAWKLGLEKERVDVFRLSQLHKSPAMKEGTWGVYGKVQHISSALKLAIIKQHGVLRAVPAFAVKKQKAIYICPGTISKEDMPLKLELELDQNLSRDEVLSALPAGAFKLCRP